MTGNPLKRVKAGERLVIPAAAYNEFVDAVAIVRRLENDLRSRGPAASREGIAVKNVSGMTIPPFSICYVSGHSGTVPEVDRVGTTVYDNGPPLLLATGAGSIADQKIGRGLLFTKPRKLTPSSGTPAYGQPWGIAKNNFGPIKNRHGFTALSGDLGDGTFLFAGHEINSLMGELDADLMAGGTAIMSIYSAGTTSISNLDITVNGTLLAGTLLAGTAIIVRWIGRWEVVNADDCEV